MSGDVHTTTERFAAAFATLSSDFDRLGAHLWRPIGERTAELAAPNAGERVLDACCGNGASAVPAAERVGPGGHVDAVDLSAALIAELEARAAGLPQVEAHCADVTTWRRGGYDVVLCVLGLFFLPDMTAGTEHLVRRARPGGQVAFTIWRRGAVEAAGRHLQGAVASVTGVEAEPRPSHLVDRINEAGAYASWLTDRGLDDVEVTVSELRVPMTPEVAWLVITGSGFAAMLQDLDHAQVADVRDAYLGALRGEDVDELDATTLIGTGRRVA